MNRTMMPPQDDQTQPAVSTAPKIPSGKACPGGNSHDRAMLTGTIAPAPNA
jgi:hypothetical protein